VSPEEDDMDVTNTSQRICELREVVAEVLELEPHEIADTADFVKDYDADSMRAIEILSRIEKKYKIEIPQSDLPEMQNLNSLYIVVARHAGWRE
jgi:acyl carrier protein